MRITQTTLRRIIKEELKAAMEEGFLDTLNLETTEQLAEEPDTMTPEQLSSLTDEEFCQYQDKLRRKFGRPHGDDYRNCMASMQARQAGYGE